MPGTQRQQQKEQTRRRILDAALEQFANQGLTKATTAGIAREAGVSHGTVFVHFPTLEALQLAAIEEFGSRVTVRLHELAEGRRSLRDVLSAHLHGLVEHEGFYTRLVIEGRLLSPDARNVLVVIQSSVAHHIGQAAEREMEDGSIRPMAMHLLFNTWVALVHYYLANGDLFAPGQSVLRRYSNDLLEHFLQLLKP